MRELVLRREQVLDAPIEEAFSFFSRAENLESISQYPAICRHE